MPKLILGNSLRKSVDQSPVLQHVLWILEALVVKALVLASGLLSPDRASAIGRRLMWLLGSRLHKSRYFARNLRIAFPDKTELEIAALVRENWGNVGAVIAEYAHLATICDREADQRIETVIDDNCDVFRDGNKRAVFVAAHLANWEVSAPAIVRLGVPLKVVYSPMQNPWLDHMLQRQRQALGCGLVNLADGIRGLVRQLADGASIGLLVDQRSDRGEPVPFFGATMLTTVIPARLALRFGCELIPVRVERLTGARFRVTFYEPIKPDDDVADDSQKVLAMTREINALFEAWIREQPHEWLCSKRKWPKKAAPLVAASLTTVSGRQ